MSEILKIDNFTPDIQSVRDSVLSGGFTTETGPDGAQYTGISKFQVPHWYERISYFIGHRITPRLSCFRLNLAGEFPHSWVHSDDICAQFASVLYLNKPDQCWGGTAFWQHTQKHIDRLPTRPELAAQNIDSDAYYASMDQEWKQLFLWDQINFVPMKFNRFITYPTCLFHSRYPFEAFGKGPADGRLIWICFYDLEAQA